MSKVELLLSEHDLSNKRGLQGFERYLTTALDTHPGRVYAFLENALLDTRIADNIELFVGLGVRPLLAFVSGNSFEAGTETAKILAKGNNIPLKSVQAILKDLSIPKYTISELSVVDNVFGRYKDPSGNPRLGLLLESTDQQTGYTAEIVGQEINRISALLGVAKFEEALALFQDHITSFAQDVDRREVATANKASQYIREGSGVVMKFGTNHRGIGKKLAAMGILVSTHYLDYTPKQVENLVDDPHSQTVFRVLDAGSSSLSTIEWYKALIGHTMYRALKIASRGDTRQMGEQQMARVALSGAGRIRTLAQIELLRRRTTETNIITALLESDL